MSNEVWHHTIAKTMNGSNYMTISKVYFIFVESMNTTSTENECTVKQNEGIFETGS